MKNNSDPLTDNDSRITRARSTVCEKFRRYSSSQTIWKSIALIAGLFCILPKPTAWATRRDVYTDSDLQYWAAHASYGDTVYVHDGTFSPFTPTVNGVKFQADPGTYIDGGWAVHSGILIANVYDDTFLWFKVQNCNYYGIACYSSTNIVVQGNYIWHCSSSGIAAWGPNGPCDNILVDGNTVDDCCDGGWNECITFDNVNNSTIEYNTVKNGGYTTNGGEGIDVKDSAYNIVIAHNTIDNIQHTGIMPDGGWGNGLSYIYIYDNKINNIGGSYGAALTIETEGTSGFQHILCYNNCIANCGATIEVWDPHPTRGGSGVRKQDDVWIQNNTIFNCRTAPLQNDTNATHVHWDNTLWVNTWNAYPWMQGVPPGSPAPRCNWSINDPDEAGFQSTNVWDSDFLQVGPNCPGNGQGCSVGNGVSYDFAGTLRPSNPDVGAWQHY